MSWLPILLVAWVAVDVLLVAAVAYLARRGDRELVTAPTPLAAATQARRLRRPSRGVH